MNDTIGGNIHSWLCDLATSTTDTSYHPSESGAVAVMDISKTGEE